MRIIDSIWKDSQSNSKDEIIFFKSIKLSEETLEKLFSEYKELFRARKCDTTILKKYFGLNIYIDNKIKDGYILER